MKIMCQTILFADNDLDFLETRQTFLENAGYHVIPATSRDEARAILEKQKIDIAIIDVRLINDKDKNDQSGLELAESVAPSVPKIILSDHYEPHLIKKALMPQLGGLHIALDFVDKDDGMQAMLTSIRRVLDIQSRLKEFDHAGNRLKELDIIFKETLYQMKLVNRVGLWVSVAGVSIIFIGIILAAMNRLEAGALGIIAGTVIKAISILFNKRGDKAYTRLEKLVADYKKFSKFNQLQTLLAACDKLLNIEMQDKCKENIINKIISSVE
jgi:CheY-like chemotaxis protein